MSAPIPSMHESSRSSYVPTIPRSPLTVVAIAGVVAIVYVASNVALGLLLGLTLAFVAEPMFLLVRRATRGRERLAALFTTTFTLALIAAIVGVAIYIVATESLSVARDVQERAAASSLDAIVGRGGVRLIEGLHLPREWVLGQFRGGAARVQSLVAPMLTGMVALTGAGAIGAVITFATMYYALFQWTSAARNLEALLPLRIQETRTLLDEFRRVGRSALVGTLGTAAVQGVFATMGYVAAGVPRASLWGLLTALAAFLPVGGTVLVWLPAALYLASLDAWGRAIGLTLWGIFGVSAVCDYVVRPWLVGGDRPVHPLLVLVALLGGVETFGLWGVIVGPVVMSVCVAALRLYVMESTRDATRPSIVAIGDALRWSADPRRATEPQGAGP